MQKALFICALVAISFLSSIQSQAQDISLKGGLELAIPTGDFGDAYSAGLGIRANGMYMISENLFADGVITYHSFGSKNNLGNGAKVKARILGVQAGMTYYLEPEQQGFFAHTALGFNPITVKIVQPKSSTDDNVKDTETKFGFTLGAGYGYGIFEGSLRWQTYGDFDGSLIILGFSAHIL